MWDVTSSVLTEKFAVVTLYSYFPARLDHTINIACELVRTVKARVTIDLFQFHPTKTTQIKSN